MSNHKSEILNLKFIDVHSHLNLSQFKDDLPQVIERMKEAQVGTIVVGVDRETSERAVELANRYENVWACVGVHPVDSKDDFDETFFEGLVENKKVVCVGECGLDYYRFKIQDSGFKNNHSDAHLDVKRPSGGKEDPKASDDARARQKKLFEKQIDFAVKNNLPLMLHVRPSKGTQDAHLDVFEILESKKLQYREKLRGNSHFFASTFEIAQRYFALGFTISFTGLITYVRDFDKIIKNTPLEMIHIETDSPFVAPVPYRGKRNEPTYVIEVAKKIALIRGVSEESLVFEMLQNSSKFFNLELD